MHFNIANCSYNARNMFIFIATKSLEEIVLLEVINLKCSGLRHHVIKNSFNSSNNTKLKTSDKCDIDSSEAKYEDLFQSLICKDIQSNISESVIYTNSEFHCVLRDNGINSKDKRINSKLKNQHSSWNNKSSKMLFYKGQHFFIIEVLIINPVHVCIFLRELHYSNIYRNKFLLYYKKKSRLLLNILKAILIIVDDEFLFPVDYKIASLCNSMLLECQHLDSAMSWLSTLGGAFSALGDYDMKFAEFAGETSRKQMKIAIRLQNPDLIARCWLYFALSLIQKAKYKVLIYVLVIS